MTITKGQPQVDTETGHLLLTLFCSHERVETHINNKTKDTMLGLMGDRREAENLFNAFYDNLLNAAEAGTAKLRVFMSRDLPAEYTESPPFVYMAFSLTEETISETRPITANEEIDELLTKAFNEMREGFGEALMMYDDWVNGMCLSKPLRSTDNLTTSLIRNYYI